MLGSREGLLQRRTHMMLLLDRRGLLNKLLDKMRFDRRGVTEESRESLVRMYHLIKTKLARRSQVTTRPGLLSTNNLPGSPTSETPFWSWP